MTTLAANEPRTLELGDRNEFPVIAADIIYEGGAVGLVIASGHARPLTSVDQFVGFAEKKADNSDGAAAALNVRTVKKGAIKLAVTDAVITDVGQPVYAQDDNTFSFIKTSGVFIGFMRRYVSAGVAIVEFDVDNFVDPWDGKVAETISTAKTLDIQDSGKVFFVDTDAKVITLPATATALKGTAIVNAGAYGTIAVNVSPHTDDAVQAADIAGTANKDYINTKTTANRGDFIEFSSGETNGPVVSRRKGTWATEG